MDRALTLSTTILGHERLLRRATASAYPAIVETETGGILVRAKASPLAITIDSPPFQGSHILDPAMLAGGPVNLVAPAIAGTALVGETLHVTPGLWSHDGLLAAPVLTWQWLRDGVPIAGATGNSLVLTSADAGQAISVTEPARDAHGAAVAVSAPLTLPAALVATQRARAAGSTAVRTFAGLDLGAPAATRDIVVLAAAIGAPGATITSVKVAGIAATRLAQTGSGGTGMVCVGAYLARVPAGSLGDVELLTSANTAAQHVGLFRGQALRLADSATAAITNAGSASMALQAGRAGGKVLAFAADNNGTAFDWTGGTELYDEDIQTGKFVSAAMGDVGPDGRAGCTARRVSGSGQIAGLMIAF